MASTQIPTSATGIPVLAMGLKSGGNFSEEDVKKAVSEQARLAAEAGFAVQPLFIDPAADGDSALAAVRDAARARTPKIVAIGFGLRGDPERTALFEKAVNAVLEEVKPPPKLTFPSRPDDAFAALQRALV